MRSNDLQRILSLPVAPDECWEGGLVPMTELLGLPPAEDPHEGPSLAVWRSSSTGLIHARPLASAQGDREQQLASFLESLLAFHDLHEFPFRPAQICCNDEELASDVGAAWGSGGPEVKFVPVMPDWDALLEELADELTGDLDAGLDPDERLPTLVDTDCDEDQVREFASAAAAFYRAQLWDYLEDVDLIQFESPTPPPSMRCANVLGAAGQTCGLGFFSDPEDQYDMLAERVDPAEVSVVSLQYDTRDDAEPPTVQLWWKLDLPLATVEAYPALLGFADGGVRAPTPQELEFATLVLQALAETTEEEIDSGVWTKSITYLGEPESCRFSIPNLTHPPDREEWMRRGLMPESRGNERQFQQVQEFIEQQHGQLSLEELNQQLNAKFTGPLDDTEYPLATAEDRAAAKCQAAIESFGRRRLQLAREALQEDPNQVEALVLLAESIRQPEKAVAAFQKAVDAGRKKLGPRVPENEGQLWGIVQARSFLRACYGLAVSLHEAGRQPEATAQYEELLRLNADDHQGVRHQLIPLLITQGRERDGVELLERYREDSTFWFYLKSLAEFRLSGPSSRKSQQAMRAAFKANELVVTALEGPGGLLSRDEYGTDLGEEALACMELLREAWEATEGYLEFLSDQHFHWDRDRRKREKDAKRKARQKKTGARRRKRR